jgi:outer membrane immunogenic protein
MKRMAFAFLAAIGMGLGQAALAAPTSSPAAPSWTGFYFGVHAGWGWTSPQTANSSLTSSGAPIVVPATFNLNSSGPLAGVQLGYNLQLANWVLGIEGDVSGTGLKDTETGTAIGANPVACVVVGAPCGTVTMSQDIKWLASMRGRVGALVGPGMAFVTGGAAWAHVAYGANTAEGLPPLQFPATLTSTTLGAVVGGGYEWMLTNNWTLRGEFLHYWLNGATTIANVPGFTATYTYGRFDINIARLGLNYRFN